MNQDAFDFEERDEELLEEQAQGLLLTDVVDLMILRYDGPNLTVDKLTAIWNRRDNV